MTQTQNVRLQNLRDFTVQIRNDADQIVGTGIAVSMEGKVVTCRHVVEAALRHKNIEGAEVGVYFPQLRGGEEKKRKAIVEKYFPSHDDDVVLLQLTGGASPLAPEQIAVLGSAGDSQDHPFRSYGYRNLQDYLAGWADGTINGCVDCPPDRTLQSDPVQVTSSHINGGMSGSAVLDKERNLVVGIISETWIPDSTTKDRDTGWAVDSYVLSLDPLGLNVQDVSLDLKPAPEPKFDKAQAEAAVFIKEKFSWNSAPTVLPEWTGRDDLLAQITEDWNNPQKHVTGLIGFGGEGKSSLARKWVESLPPFSEKKGEGSGMGVDGVFWWGFYENRSIDEFLESALNFLSGGRIDPRQVPSSSLRAQIIGAMLGAGRYLFVLDGLEVLQHQEGDQYGLLTSNDLRDLLTYFARPDNQSFCLITSRAPVLDLMDYTTYTHRDVERLSEADGVALLERLQVKGSKSQLGKVVADWDGHALTISLLGSYLAEKYNGDIAHLADIPIPTADEPRYERVHRVLRRYDEHLNNAEREFLKIFSAFRVPVHESAFEKVFQPLLSPFFSLDETLPVLVARLVKYRLLRTDLQTKTYTTHPLIRNYYHAYLKHDTRAPDIHLKIIYYYRFIESNNTQYRPYPPYYPFPSLEDLKPLVEVVYHACQAGLYDKAHEFRRDRIDQGTKFILIHQLGAYETALSLMYEFFPNNDATKEPQCSRANANRFILQHVGSCLMGMGRLRDAVPFFERFNVLAVEAQDWSEASVYHQNLSELHAELGLLDASANAARQALDLARRAKNKTDELISLSYFAYAKYLQGDLNESRIFFEQAEEIDLKINPLGKYLLRNPGVWYVDFLRRTNKRDSAYIYAEANLRVCDKNNWAVIVGMCHRVLGDLDFDSGNQESARAHYESALKIARSISKRDVLIEALLARGRFYAKTSEVFLKDSQTVAEPGKTSEVYLEQAFTDLNEALNYAVEGGYRIYEADIRVALAWAHLAKREEKSDTNVKREKVKRVIRNIKGKKLAKEQATRALQMSQEMGYHWGKVDAEEMMKAEG